MWGEKYLCAFLAGNIIQSIAGKLFSFHIPSLLISALILITISIYFGFKQKFPKFTLCLTLSIMMVLGFINGSRSRQVLPAQTSASNTPLKEKFSGIRGKITDSFIFKTSQIIKNEEDMATILAFTIGNKEHLHNDTKEAYKNSGAMHVLALSGLHIGILYGMVELLLFFLDFSYFSRRVKFLICSVTIFIYTAITGFGASVTRASIMMTLHHGIKIYLRTKGRWTTWLCSANIILLFDPDAIADIGFQLSYAAVAGIIALYPYMNAAYAGPKLLRPLWKTLSISIACQITTLPFILYYFNASPIYFLITNLAAIPLVTLSVYSFAIAYITSGIPYINDITSEVAASIIRILNIIIGYLGR